jgi:hypothetical protein
MREVGTRGHHQEEEVEEAASESLEELLKYQHSARRLASLGHCYALLIEEAFGMRSLQFIHVEFPPLIYIHTSFTHAAFLRGVT